MRWFSYRTVVMAAMLALAMGVAPVGAQEEEHPMLPFIMDVLPENIPDFNQCENGDLLVIDYGATVDGYFSDITRTFVLGRPTPKIEAMHDAVLAANQAGRLAVRPNMPAQEVDRIARRAINLAGYSEFFIHRTGHGLGLETHEPPYIVEGNLTLLQAGMTFTVEPGVYVPDLGGVRIEDDVLVTEGGSETLTTLDRKLVVI